MFYLRIFTLRLFRLFLRSGYFGIYFVISRSKRDICKIVIVTFITCVLNPMLKNEIIQIKTYYVIYESDSFVLNMNSGSSENNMKCHIPFKLACG